MTQLIDSNKSRGCGSKAWPTTDQRAQNGEHRARKAVSREESVESKAQKAKHFDVIKPNFDPGPFSYNATRLL